MCVSFFSCLSRDKFPTSRPAAQDLIPCTCLHLFIHHVRVASHSPVCQIDLSKSPFLLAPLQLCQGIWLLCVELYRNAIRQWQKIGKWHKGKNLKQNGNLAVCVLWFFAKRYLSSARTTSSIHYICAWHSRGAFDSVADLWKLHYISGAAGKVWERKRGRRHEPPVCGNIK